MRTARAALAAGTTPAPSRCSNRSYPLLSGEQLAEVRLLYGQAQVGDQQFTRGLATSQALLSSTTRPDLVSAARLLNGQALRGLERWDEAASEMRAVADANPLIAAAVRLELEDMWLTAKRPDEAAADGQKGLDVAQARLAKIYLAENLATAEVALNQTDAAMDAYRQLLTAAGSKGYLGEQLYNLAAGASQLGRTDDAINALRTSISQFPKSRNAPEAADLLEKLGGMRPEDRFYSGVIRYLFWNFRAARADFDTYLAAFPDGDRAVEARYYRALSSAAQDTTTQLLQLASDVPDDDFAPMALLEAGKAQEELGDYASAEGIYDRLVATYPTRDAGLAGAFRRGLARYMRSDVSGALTAWSELLLGRDPEPSVRAEALYWSGKALDAQGDDVAARAKYQAAAAVRPVSYYALRAQVALDPPPASADFDPAQVVARRRSRARSLVRQQRSRPDRGWPGRRPGPSLCPRAGARRARAVSRGELGTRDLPDHLRRQAGPPVLVGGSIWRDGSAQCAAQTRHGRLERRDRRGSGQHSGRPVRARAGGLTAGFPRHGHLGCQSPRH